MQGTQRIGPGEQVDFKATLTRQDVCTSVHTPASDVLPTPVQKHENPGISRAFVK
jgi:hypothetical protein